MPRKVMDCLSPADALLMMCQGPDKTELSEEPSYRATFTSGKEVEPEEVQDTVEAVVACQEKLRAKIEDMIAEAVRNVGIEVVDKEGLIAALKADKQRYEEAYKKGYRACEKLLDKAIQVLYESGSTLPCDEMYGNGEIDSDFCWEFCKAEFNGPQEECWKEYLSEWEHRHS